MTSTAQMIRTYEGVESMPKRFETENRLAELSAPIADRARQGDAEAIDWFEQRGAMRWNWAL